MSSALIVVDMLNAYDHDDAKPLKASVEHVFTPVRKLIDSANEQGFDVLYVNDNFGDWSAGQEQDRGGRPERVSVQGVVGWF